MQPFVHDVAASRTVFGAGAASSLPAEAERLGIGRAVILCSRGRRDVAESLAAGFNQGVAAICDAAEPGMPQHAVDRVIGELRDGEGAGLIALGGGSPIGIGKTVAALSKCRFIAVVTTYSGSERADNWYIGSGPDRKGGRSPDAVPATVIYDPELTLDLPPKMSAASAMNAMAHAAESLYGPDTNPVVQTLSEEAVRMLYGSMPAIMADPTDVGARGRALYGAWLAAEFRATAGLSHALAQQVRTRFELPHAQCHAIMLPYALAFNREAAPEAMERLRRALGADDPAAALYTFNRRWGLPTGLGALGLTESDIEAATDAVAGAKFANPRPAGRDDIRKLIAAALEGAPPRI
ncbi:MAG: iron-containing alcohol dehydrogenase [Alphaproteobacteria bacterium]|nr:iron-containing alcohol dehydrogenase [Alphaproteobacteria bacterium]